MFICTSLFAFDSLIVEEGFNFFNLVLLLLTSIHQKSIAKIVACTEKSQ